MNKYIKVFALFLVVGLAACKKDFLNRQPTDQLQTSEVFSTIDGAEAAVQGMNRMMYEVVDHDLFGYPSVALLWDLMGDDMSLSGFGSGWFVDAYRINDSRSPASTGAYVWSYFYRFVNNANYILDRTPAIEASQNRKDYVLAAAHFYRAFAYYNLVNCYMFTYKGVATSVVVPVGLNPDGSGMMGTVSSFKDALGVPLYTRPTTVDSTQGNPRASVEDVYTFIINDLDEAIRLFEASGVGRSDKSEINIDVAKGLYARVALVMQNWGQAELMAHEARASYQFMTGEQLLGGFNDASNAEWIWGSVINNEQNGIYASFLSQMDFDMNGYAALGSEKRVSLKLFNENLDTAFHDVRRSWWIGRYEKVRDQVPYATYSQRKFKGKSTASFAGDFPLMRASEMALIEMEAMTMQGKTTQATDLLYEWVRTRQPEYAKTFASDSLLTVEIRNQRRIELWGEGFRYFDLQRYFAVFPTVAGIAGMDRGEAGGHSAGIASKMSVQAYSYDYLFRIPGGEREQNPQVVQNP